MKWSYSSIKQAMTCAKQYQEVRILKNYPHTDTPQTLYGKEVHTALENYIRGGTPLPENFKRFQRLVDPIRDIAGQHLPEHKMALLEDKITPCDFEAGDYWVRGIADLLVVDGPTGFVVDYKTGNPKYADTKQLKLMALMMFAHFPEIKKVRAGLLFLLHNRFIPTEYARSAEESMWADFEPELNRMKFYYGGNIWPANPSGLCKKHCPVKTCKYNGRANAEDYDG